MTKWKSEQVNKKKQWKLIKKVFKHNLVIRSEIKVEVIVQMFFETFHLMPVIKWKSVILTL